MVATSHCHDVDDVRRNWAKTEPPELLELSYKIDWNYSKKIDEMSVDEVWEEVHGKLNDITECIPWINSSLKCAIRNKIKAWAAFDNCPNISSLNLALSKQDIYANFEISTRNLLLMILNTILKLFMFIFVIAVKLSQLLQHLKKTSNWGL